MIKNKGHKKSRLDQGGFFNNVFPVYCLIFR